MTQGQSWRDDEIRRATQAAEDRRVEEVKIAQKIGLAHRAAFREKFPGQIEHCMRLIAERLQKGLAKDAEIAISDCSAKDLTWALWNLYQIQQQLEQE